MPLQRAGRGPQTSAVRARLRFVRRWLTLLISACALSIWALSSVATAVAAKASPPKGIYGTAIKSGNPALNGTWDWMEKDLTLTTVPGAGHFVQQDAAELVTKTMRAWLLR